MSRTKTVNKYKRPSGGNNRLPKFILLGVAAAVLLVYFLSGPRGTINLYKHSHEKQELLDEIKTLETQKAELDSEKVKLEDDAYIEKIAREEYNMKKKGEKVYKVSTDKNKD